MSVSYDIFTNAFLDKVTEFDFPVTEYERNSMIDRYMKRSVSRFRKICKYDLSTTGDDLVREFNIVISEEDLEEIADIISEGMVFQWLSPYVNKQENLENVLNTRDFTAYSPSELLFRVRERHERAQLNFRHRMREYSFNHGDISSLHI